MGNRRLGSEDGVVDDEAAVHLETPAPAFPVEEREDERRESLTRHALAFGCLERVIEKVRALPGVTSAAWIDSVPMQGGSTQYVSFEGQPPMKDSELPVVQVRLPSPDYFKTAKIPFVRGRDFTAADGLGRPRVVISR